MILNTIQMSKQDISYEVPYLFVWRVLDHSILSYYSIFAITL